jgi:phenylalanyl-tRNA synthetase beta chain
MQISEHWLRTMVNPALNAEDLAHLLTMSGLEVEALDTVVPPFDKVVVAQITACEKHPDADRLNVCKVNTGSGDLLTIVCGASNVRAGMKVACAQVGAVLPPGDDGKPFVINEGKLRGVTSQGMLCSARELAIADEHTGIMDLPSDAPIGMSVRDYLDLDDLKFTLKLTPNRADCLSLLGIAREVSALTGAELCIPTVNKAPVTFDESLPVKISAPELCGRFSGRVIRGVNAKAKTPDWMKQRLERSGQRSVSALVDISNYVMLEMGQPSHVFDLDKLSGGLDVRWGKVGETIKLLNGNTIEVDSRVGVIATTGDKPILESLAGIMGGDATAVTLETNHIYLEAAFWWPQAIQGRARRYNFSTDASHRYERGVDFAATVDRIERITDLIITICGGQAGPIDDQIVNVPHRAAVKCRTARVAKVLGFAVQESTIAQVFDRLGFSYKKEADGFVVTPPSYRFDIEIEEDLIEEVARLIGFDTIPALPPTAPAAMRILSERVRSLFDVRRHLADLDYQEAINFSFVDEAWERDFANNHNAISLQNPIASQMSVMRSTLIASLVANAAHNIHRKIHRIRLFEIASTFCRDDSVKEGDLSVAGIKETQKIAGLAYGPAVEEQWGESSRQVDFFDVKGDIEALFSPKTLKFNKLNHPALHPGRCAHIACNGQLIGFVGELHPALQQKYDLPLAPIVFEVNAAALQDLRMPTHHDISKFQAVTRDMALVVDVVMPAQALLDVLDAECATNPDCRYVKSIHVFDEYRGKGLGEHEKSLAFRCTLQDPNATLQDETIDAAIAALINVARAKCEAKLRS